jgi:hypothetical protein
MATMQQILAWEDAVEAAAKSILTAAGATAYRQRDTDTMTSPACAVQATNFREGAMQYQVSGEAFRAPAQFACQLTVSVITERTKNASSHTTNVGKCRAGIYDLDEWTSQRIPYHQIVACRATGSSEELDAARNYDITTLQFELEFLTRSNAWPT